MYMFLFWTVKVVLLGEFEKYHVCKTTASCNRLQEEVGKREHGQNRNRHQRPKDIILTGSLLHISLLFFYENPARPVSSLPSKYHAPQHKT